jgi:hypothetical protein
MSPLISRIGTVLIGLVSTVSLATGCNQGAEGDRCNPDLSHDECGSGLQCTQPLDCDARADRRRSVPLAAMLTARPKAATEGAAATED